MYTPMMGLSSDQLASRCQHGWRDIEEQVVVCRLGTEKLAVEVFLEFRLFY